MHGQRCNRHFLAVESQRERCQWDNCPGCHSLALVVADEAPYISQGKDLVPLAITQKDDEP